MSLNPFRAGRCLSTRYIDQDEEFQLSIPFEQGDVFRLNINQALNVLNLPQSLSSRAMSFDLKNFYLINLGEQVSIPFEQGDVFRRRLYVRFRTSGSVSIPFEQGDVFRLQRYAGGRNHAAFQTHFPIFLEG